MTRGGGGGGGGTLIFSYIRRLGPIFGVQYFEIQYFRGLRKNEYFFGMKMLWIYILGSSQNWTIFRGHSMHLGTFLKVKVQNWGYFLGLLKFKYCFGVLEILDIF